MESHLPRRTEAPPAETASGLAGRTAGPPLPPHKAGPAESRATTGRGHCTSAQARPPALSVGPPPRPRPSLARLRPPSSPGQGGPILSSTSLQLILNRAPRRQIA